MRLCDERMTDFYGVYMKLIEKCTFINRKDIISKAINHPARKFYITPERGTIIIVMMKNGFSLDGYMPHTREKYKKLYELYKQEKEKRPKDSIFNIMIDVVEMPAPRFYMTYESACCLLSKYIREGRKCLKSQLSYQLS